MANKQLKHGRSASGDIGRGSSNDSTKTAPPAQLDEQAIVDLSKTIQAQFQDFHTASKKPVINGYAKRSSSMKAGKRHQVPPPHPTRGKKRDNEGKITQTARVTTSQDSLVDAEQMHPGLDALENEVYALGGTAEDLDLIAGVESKSELENIEQQTSKNAPSMHHDQGFQNGISNILGEIALAQKSRPSQPDRGQVVEKDSSPNGGAATAQQLQKPQKLPATIATSRKKDGLIFHPRPDWFNASLPSIELLPPANFTLPRKSLDQLHEYAKSLLDAENQAFRISQQKSSAQSFYNMVIVSGTLSDKISALTLAVQESPIHNVKALETLVGLAKKRSRAQAVDVLRALKDLFAQGSLLPSDRRLFAFHSQPALGAAFGQVKPWATGDALPKAVQPCHLLIWAFESWLKEQYFEVLKTLEIWCNDEIEYSKSRAVSFVFELLKEKPEQEANLLLLLINKLGDPIKKVASQTSYLLMQLMAAHPLMKGTIISAVESDLLFRPGQSLHAKYYAIVTLNQTVLSSKEEEVAIKLLNLYFSLFIGLLKPREEPKGQRREKSRGHGDGHRKHSSANVDAEKGKAQEEEVGEKLISAILTGINRAYPYVNSDQQSLSTHLDALFKITHSSNFNTSIQAMMLIQQLSASHQILADRFYRTLYESLLDARLITSSKQALYLNLLYKALKSDMNARRVKAFAKRILQILTLHQPSFICGAFFLMKELEATFPSLIGLIDQAEEHEMDKEAIHDANEDLGRSLTAARSTTDAAPRRQTSSTYDGRKRDPEHSNAENSCMWELLPFLAHFHPSVAVGADHILRHAKLPGKPDLNLHTLIHFLDRFVYRNPKMPTSHLRGSSIMQPLAASNAGAVLVRNTVASKQAVPVNSEGSRAKKGNEVAAEDVFFHKYFSSLGKEASKKKGRDRADAEGDKDEDEIWNAMVGSAPDLRGAHQSDDDLTMSDLESDFEHSLDEMSGDDLGEEGLFGDDNMPAFEEEETGGASAFVQAEADSASAAFNGDEAAGERAKPGIPLSRQRRCKRKQLPTFAVASDYAKELDDENEDEDLGP